MSKFTYLFAIVGFLALSTAQIVEPNLFNDGNVVPDAAPIDGPSVDDNEEVGILTPFEDDLPVDGDSDYFLNDEDYDGLYENFNENAEGLVGTPDELNDDFGYVEDPIIAEEFIGLVDVPEPLNEEDATIGEAIVEPFEDPIEFNRVSNSALENDDFESWEAIVDTVDSPIESDEGFVDYPDALIELEEATVDIPEVVIDFEEATVDEPEALVDLEEGNIELPDDFVDFEAGENISEAIIDYPDNLTESGEDFAEALIDYPDDLVESGEDFAEALVDYPDDLIESEEVIVQVPEDDADDFGEADYPDNLIESEEDDVEIPEAPVDIGEVDYPEDLTEEEAIVDEPEAVIDAGEVDYPEDPREEEDDEIGFAVNVKPVVELDPRVLDTNEEESTQDANVDDSDDQGYMPPEQEEEDDIISSNNASIEPDNIDQGEILIAEGIDEVAVDGNQAAAEEESKNFLGQK